MMSIRDHGSLSGPTVTHSVLLKDRFDVFVLVECDGFGGMISYQAHAQEERTLAKVLRGKALVDECFESIRVAAHNT